MMFPSTSAGPISDMDEQRILNELFDAFMARREKAKKINTCLYGEGFSALVDAKIRERFDDDTYTAMKLDHGIATWNRLLQDVVGKAAIECQEGLTIKLRKVDGVDEEAAPDDEMDPEAEPADDDVHDARTENHLKQMAYDALMQDLDDLCFLHWGVLVVPEVLFSPRIGMRKHTHQVYTPEHFDVEPCDDNAKDYQSVAIYCPVKGSKTKFRKRVWSLDEWADFETDTIEGKREWALIKRGKNQYGQIPGVLFQGQPSKTQLHGPAHGDWLADMTIEVNTNETFLSLNGSLQIKVLGGVFDDMAAGQNWRPGGVLQFGSGEQFSSIDMQTNGAAYRETWITALRKQAAVTVGLSPNAFEVNFDAATSGLSLRMQEWILAKRARPRRAAFKDALEELIWLDLRVLWVELRRPSGDVPGSPPAPIAGYEGDWVPGQYVDVNGVPVWVINAFNQQETARADQVLPPYVPGVVWQRQPYKFDIDIHERDYPMTPDEQQSEAAWRVSQGFATAGEIWAEIDPDIDPSTVDARMEANLAKTARLNRLKAGLSGGGGRTGADALKGGPAGPRAGGLAQMGAQIADTLAGNAQLTQDPKDLAAAEKAIDGASKIGAAATPTPPRSSNG